MPALDWRLTLAALVLMPIVLAPNRYVGRATYRADKWTQEKLAEMSSYMREVLGIVGIQLVKARRHSRRGPRLYHPQVNALSTTGAMQSTFTTMGHSAWPATPRLVGQRNAKPVPVDQGRWVSVATPAPPQFW